MSGRGLQEETEGRFFYSHLQWRGVLGPSSVPFLGVIQDMYLGDTHKGREVFSEVCIQYPAKPTLIRRGKGIASGKLWVSSEKGGA
jgi:hypothetical protein